MSQRTFVHVERVRHSDTDAQGVVNSIMFFYYMEAARFEFWRSLGVTLSDLHQKNLTFYVARQCCEYLAPVYHDDLIRIGVQLKEIGRTSLTLLYTMKVKRKSVAKGEIVLVCILRTNRKPTPLPPFLLRKLKA